MPLKFLRSTVFLHRILNISSSYIYIHLPSQPAHQVCSPWRHHYSELVPRGLTAAQGKGSCRVFHTSWLTSVEIASRVSCPLVSSLMRVDSGGRVHWAVAQQVTEASGRNWEARHKLCERVNWELWLSPNSCGGKLGEMVLLPVGESAAEVVRSHWTCPIRFSYGVCMYRF